MYLTQHYLGDQSNLMKERYNLMKERYNLMMERYNLMKERYNLMVQQLHHKNPLRDPRILILTHISVNNKPSEKCYISFMLYCCTASLIQLHLFQQKLNGHSKISSWQKQKD